MVEGYVVFVTLTFDLLTILSFLHIAISGNNIATQCEDCTIIRSSVMALQCIL